MKKVISVLLSLIFIISLCGCANKNNSSDLSAISSKYAINIAALAENGKIPEIKFALGTAVSEVKEKFKSTIPEGSEVEDLTVTEGQKTVWLDGGNVMFCYEKDKESNGISVIVAKEEAYNFSLGGIYAEDDVTDAMGSNVNYEKSAVTAADVFFMPVMPDNCEKISYVTGKNVLNFIFVDGTLSSVVLYNTENWTIK